jgi:hypothetical protein
MPGSFTAGGLGNAIGGPWTKKFSYDDLHRLTSSTGTHNVSATPTFTYSFSQVYDSIHNITHKTQAALQDTAVNPQTSYDFAYSYPAPGSAHPHGPTAIGGFTITNDADGWRNCRRRLTPAHGHIAPRPPRAPKHPPSQTRGRSTRASRSRVAPCARARLPPLVQSGHHLAIGRRP